MGYYLDELAQLSVNPYAPAGERWDANAEAFKMLRDGLESPDLDELRQDIALAQNDPFFVGKSTRLVPMLRDLEVDGAVTRRGHSSILRVNEYGVVSGSGQGGYVEKLNGFEFLRQISQGVDMNAAFMFTYARQIANHCERQRDESPLGFGLKRCDGEDLTDSDHREVRDIEDWLWNCGDERDVRKRKAMGRDDFPTWIRKLVWDTLSYDACPIETELTNSGKLSGWYQVPGDSVRLCSEDGYQGDDQIFALQLFQGQPHVAYRYNDLIYEVRNPRTDMYVNGYGFAESETIVRVITGYLNAFTYNASGIDRSTIPRGILTLFGDYDKRQLKQAQHHWNAMLMGAANRHKFPLMASKTKEGGAQWTPIDQFDEMFFARFMTLCWSIAGAVWGMDPTMVHIESFAARNSSTLNGNDTEEKLAVSRIKGLLPLLGFIKRIINTYLLPLRTKKYEFQWVGLHDEDENRKEKRILLTSTVDELREMDGKKPHPNPVIGGAPVDNSNLTGLYLATMGMGGDMSGDDEQGQRAPKKAEAKGTDKPVAKDQRQQTARRAGDDERKGEERPARTVTKSSGPFRVVIDRGLPAGMDGYGG